MQANPVLIPDVDWNDPLDVIRQGQSTCQQPVPPLAPWMRKDIRNTCDRWLDGLSVRAYNVLQNCMVEAKARCIHELPMVLKGSDLKKFRGCGHKTREEIADFFEEVLGNHAYAVAVRGYNGWKSHPKP